MSVDIKVTRRLPNDYVQIDVTPKNADTRHYKVPIDKADSFTADYKKYDSKTRTNATILSTCMMLAGGFAGAIIPKLLKGKGFFSIIFGVVGALAGDVCATTITSKNMQKNEAALLKANDAKEFIFKEGKSFLDSRSS